MRIRYFSKPVQYIMLFLVILITGCWDGNSRNIKVAAQQVAKEDPNDIIPAAERIGIYYNIIKDKRIACVVNHTSRVGSKHLVDTLLAMDVNVSKVFAPEHGFRGDIPDGQAISDATDPETGIPIISLYGNKKKPEKEDLAGIDVVIFDIQDVGARFYTFLSTLHYIMEACAEHNIQLIVLDRPNPNLHYIDGPVLELDQKSFVGMHPVPIVYGMTIGEYALMINGEGWLANGLKCDLEVISVKNYGRSSFYEIPIAPSPNLPNQRSILLYPSLCFFEGTQVSVGRGTDRQFQLLGHPGLNDHTFQFTPSPNKGSRYPKHDGETCFGEDLSSIPIGELMRQSNINLSWLMKYYKEITAKGYPFFIENSHFDRIAGTKKLKEQLLNNFNEEEIRASWKDNLEKFKTIRSKYLIYS